MMMNACVTAIIGAASLAGGWIFAPELFNADSVGGGDEPQSRNDGTRHLVPEIVATSRKESPSEQLFGILANGGSTSGNDFVARMAALEGLDADNATAEEIRAALIREWVEADPEGAFRYALEDPARRSLKEIVGLWAERDGENAVRAVEGLGNGGLKDDLLGSCATALARTDTEGAVRLLKAHSLLEEVSEDFFAALAEGDRDFGLKTIAEIPDENARTRALGKFMAKWAESDPAEACAALAGDSRWAKCNGWAWELVAENWFKIDPDAALMFFGASKGSEWFNQCLRTIMPGLLAHDPDAALAFARGLAGDDRGSAMLFLAYALDGRDAAMSMKVVLDSSDAVVSKTVFRSWARQDWEGALKAMLGLDKGPLRDAALEGFTLGLQRSKIVGSAGIGNWVEPMMRLAAESGNGKLDLSWAVPSMSPEEITRYATEYGDRFVMAVTRGFEQLARDNPVAAAAMADALPDTRGRSELIQPIAAEWAQVNPSAAGAWVAALPDGEGREMAFRNVAGTWARHDPAQAARWIGELPESPARDAAVGEYVSVAASSGNAAMVEMARSISDEVSRNDAIFAALSGWVGREGDGALTVIEGMDLPDEMKQRAKAEAESERWWRELGK